MYLKIKFGLFHSCFLQKPTPQAQLTIFFFRLSRKGPSGWNLKTKFSNLMEPKSYDMHFLCFQKLISQWSRLRFFLAVCPCDHAVDSFPKWCDPWKSAQKWGRESRIFNLVTFLTNTKKFKNPWPLDPFLDYLNGARGCFLRFLRDSSEKNSQVVQRPN